MQQFYMPVRVVEGAGCVRAAATLIAPLGKCALIVTGRSSKKNGALSDVVAALEGNGQRYAVFDEVLPNPTIACVRAGAARAKEAGADFVIAIGGGSPMDAAKAIALLARQDIADADLFAGKYSPDVLPMVHIPTTAGTGSEVTQYSILTDDVAESKTSIATPYIFPRLALLDGGYMASLSHNTTVNTAIDALSHAVEGMLSVKAGEVSGLLAKESISIICSLADAIAADTLTPADRQKLLHASMLAGMVIANTGTTAVHAMGYSLTYYHEIDHGRANGLLLGAFVAFCAQHLPERTDAILQAGGFESPAAFSQMLAGLLGQREALTDAEMKKYAAKAIAAKNIANCAYQPTEAELYQMLKISLEEK